MATAQNEVLENSSASENVSVEQNHENLDSEMRNHGSSESQPFFSEDEVRSALETSASTGKFWQDWEKLKIILSYHLKQVWGGMPGYKHMIPSNDASVFNPNPPNQRRGQWVLSEYPEAKMTSEQQASSLGETFPQLVKRLDDAFHSFDEGPPFTLQRLCEILLSARSIYPKLSKLSLALEKNLLVTSTLTISSDPYPLPTKQSSNGTYEGNGNAMPQTSSVANEVEHSVGDRDEIMAEAQEAEVGEDVTMDMQTTEDNMVRSSEENPTPTVEHSKL